MHQKRKSIKTFLLLLQSIALCTSFSFQCLSRPSLLLQTRKYPDRTRIGLAIDPNVVEAIHHHHQLHNAITSSHVLVNAQDIAYPIGQTIAPTALKTISSAATSTPASGVAERGFEIVRTSTSDSLVSPFPDQREVQFYAREADLFSKLPLAAAVYVAFEFFFMNQKRQMDMYYYDEYDEDEFGSVEEAEEAAQVAEFWGMVALRTVAAFLITFLTVVVSKMTFGS